MYRRVVVVVVLVVVVVNDDEDEDEAAAVAEAGGSWWHSWHTMALWLAITKERLLPLLGRQYYAAVLFCLVGV